VEVFQHVPAVSVMDRPAAPQLSTAQRRRRLGGTLMGVVAILVAVNVFHRMGVSYLGLALGPAVAGVLLVIARRHGLTWDDLGLSRRACVKGAVYAVAAVAAVALVYAVAAALPLTRSAFLDVRYRLTPGSALMTALVVIPLGTILLEEVAFRGVLFGLLRSHRGTAWATGLSSALFGLWHIVPSLGLNTDNAAAGQVFGGGSTGQTAVIAAVVVFTALAGVLLCELRRRSGSLLASAGLHWATNGLGVLLAAVVWAAVAQP
jgi:membrane protease YdiL (CAAX protease family)